MTHVFMGVAGCGKSEVGRRVADRLGLPFEDADAFHPRANVEKMAGGTPLTDADRAPWLDAMSEAIAAWNRGGGAALACSALKRSYRDRLREAGDVFFVHLAGDRETIALRMAAREDHFMPPSLLDSQFRTLEDPAGEPGVVAVSIEPPLDEVVAAAADAVRAQRTGEAVRP
ncbi:gluconokinase [Phycisphaera mikurensis]|uniref:Gluconokinase n=1 Tax=Phycisphaera mikurensis (strain NBRC 102666 / KCTC 22515 / FYK2301M01) TaxID=1142394 RepID=I0IGU3_PHYMF|nr:gluconokinase [Phycisphaera mikurensis]MBB6440738.1 gluconokinase [Phycisphaera mikurensis]BAM04481.1 gluconokinase [Phycisphaera mikurensis NBRC 102666]